MIYTEKKHIERWLDKFGVTGYTITTMGKLGLAVDVHETVDLSHRELTSFGVRFRHVRGDFLCDNNRLTSLEGAPHIVGGHFQAYHNQLSNLIGGPRVLGGNYSVAHNQLTNLEGAPVRINKNFNCSHNLLSTLNEAPDFVEGYFYADNNQLTSLEHCSMFKAECDFRDNPLLGAHQFFEQYTDIIPIIKIIEEQRKLMQEIIVSKKTNNTYKI